MFAFHGFKYVIVIWCFFLHIAIPSRAFSFEEELSTIIISLLFYYDNIKKVEVSKPLVDADS